MNAPRIPDFARGRSIIREDLACVLDRLAGELGAMSGSSMLVTGAAGMLPSYLVDLLAFANEQGALAEPVTLYPLVRTRPEPNSRLGHLLGRPDVQFLVQDAVEPVLLPGPVQYVVHAASSASPRWYRQDPVGTVVVNSVGLHNLLEASRAWETESFLYFSSSEVYGSPGPDNIPTPESFIGEVDFTSGRACYSESKRFGELLCATHHEQHGAPTKVVRPFHIHGPGQRLDDGRVVAEMIRLGLEGRPFELLSDGRATRTYGYIADATLGFMKVLLSAENGQAFNVGADSPETSILELATAVSGIFDRDEAVRVSAGDVPEHLSGAPVRVCPDLAKIRSTFSFDPKIGLIEGLTRTVRWHQAVRSDG